MAKLFLRTATVSGAGVLRFPDTPIMCLRVSDDIDAVIWVKNASIILVRTNFNLLFYVAILSREEISVLLQAKPAVG